MHGWEVLAAGDTELLCRPCVDCGLYTGRFCDHCLAEDRIPSEVWADGQHTPLCSWCDNRHEECHYCRKIQWSTPFPHQKEEDLEEKLLAKHNEALGQNARTAKEEAHKKATPATEEAGKNAGRRSKEKKDKTRSEQAKKHALKTDTAALYDEEEPPEEEPTEA